MDGGTERFATLDGLRGLAVMGILLMNITAFALPEGAYFNPAAYGSHGPADYVAWGATFLAVDGKMRALFSLLFGASMALIVDRARAGGASGAAVHYRRMLVLALFGAVHLWAIWWGDILLHYALVGALAYAFVDKSPRAAFRLGILFLVIQLLVATVSVAGLHFVEVQGTMPGAKPAMVAGWLDTRALIGVPTPDRLAAELALCRGPWSGIAHRLFEEGLSGPLSLLMAGGVETLGLMLLGMAGLRSGFLTGAWPRAAYVRVALWGHGIGLAGTAVLLVLCVWSRFDSLTVFAATYAGGTPFRPAIMAGHAALGILWLTGGDEGAGLRARVIAAGRAAFTNYLGTSVVMTAIFYGWGLGLFGMVDRAALYLFVIAGWVAMLAWSRPFLARYRYGPLEWLWRSLARGSVQPFVR